MSIQSPAKCEIPVVIRYLVWKGKTSVVVYNEVKTAYGDKAMNRTSVFKWCREFKNGRTSVHDDQRSETPSIVTDEIVEKIENALRDDPKLTVDELSAMFPQISRSLLHETITETLAYRKLSSRTKMTDVLSPGKVKDDEIESLHKSDMWKLIQATQERIGKVNRYKTRLVGQDWRRLQQSIRTCRKTSNHENTVNDSEVYNTEDIKEQKNKKWAKLRQTVSERSPEPDKLADKARKITKTTNPKTQQRLR
ncbi:hypothetical protein ILUMI_18757 [Ignelater luminosus]|uniref:Mos1 transposase HTH domain-containing protein n=1 Tax=Ignelater luminosus TaxID=2038154 RepID=A0A8K0G687_IGNLU|nr:hypothetical protein ILUMI_18757 [Ignelater luminosus]